jgi:rod shape-determining protein MreC
MLSVFIFKNRRILSFLLLLAISFTMMGIATSDFTLNFKAIFLTVLYPFEYVINGVLNFFKSTWESIGQLEIIRDELAETRERLKKFEEESGSLSTLRQENVRLRELLGEKEAVRYGHTLARIISKDPQNLYQSLIIDKGSSDGITRDMPVVAFHQGVMGVVGRVVRTTPNAALVATIRQPRFYIGALLETSRYYGFVRGNGISRTVTLEYVDINAPVKLNDMVLSSGHSDIFPSGLAIGTVIFIDRSKDQFFLEARLQPVVNFDQLEDVFVLEKTPSAEILELVEGME